MPLKSAARVAGSVLAQFLTRATVSAVVDHAPTLQTKSSAGFGTDVCRPASSRARMRSTPPSALESTGELTRPDLAARYRSFDKPGVNKVALVVELEDRPIVNLDQLTSLG